MTPEAALTKLSYLLGRSHLTHESRIEVLYALRSYISCQYTSANYIEKI
jgi:hypothetical protein